MRFRNKNEESELKMIGIILLNYNTADDVEKCVCSIKENVQTDYHIYIVDNSSTDRSYDRLSKKFKEDKEISVFLSSVNGGFSAGNNIGIRESLKNGDEYICIVNADVVFLNDALTKLKNKLDQDLSIGVAAPSIIGPESEDETQFARNKLTYNNYLSEKTVLRHLPVFEKKYPRYVLKNHIFEEDFKFMGMTYGCCYLIRSTILKKNNGLDDSVFLFGEEDILAYQLEKQSYYTCIVPSAKILHNHHSSIKKSGSARTHLYLRISPLIVLNKYAQVPTIKLYPIVLVGCINWIFKSIASEEYRNYLGYYVHMSFDALKKKA